MIATKREKYIAYGTGAAIALLILNSYVIDPYFQARSDIESSFAFARQQAGDNSSTLNAQKVLAKKWAAIQGSGLKTDQAAADSQLQHALLDWAQEAGVSPQNLKADLPRKEGSFLIIGYRMTATGSMRAIARLVWALETAPIPVRVSDLRITPQRERTDDLSVQIGVSTLCTPLDPKAAGATPAKPAARPMTAPAPAGTRPTTQPTRPAAQLQVPAIHTLAWAGQMGARS